MKVFTRFMRSGRGATAIEYALLASLIAVALIAGMMGTSGSINTKFNAASSAIAGG